MSKIIFNQLDGTPSSQPAGATMLYTKTDGLLYGKDAANQEMQLVVLSGGKVGIGTTAPSVMLHVSGGTSVTGGGTGSPPGVPGLHFIYDPAGGISYIKSDHSGTTNKALYFEGSAYSFTGAGNVGIGTTTPLGQLHIQHTTNTGMASANHIFGLSTGGISISAVPIAKAWVNFNGESTVAIGNSYNVASLTDNGAGDYTVNFATDITSAAYCAVGSSGGGSNPDHHKNLNIYTQAVGSVRVITTDTGNSLADCTHVNVTIFAL